MHTRMGGNSLSYARAILKPGSYIARNFCACQLLFQNGTGLVVHMALTPVNTLGIVRPTWGHFLTGEGAMSGSTSAQLWALLSPEQAEQLKVVRKELINNPKALDTHSREAREAKQTG